MHPLLKACKILTYSHNSTRVLVFLRLLCHPDRGSTTSYTGLLEDQPIGRLFHMPKPPARRIEVEAEDFGEWENMVKDCALHAVFRDQERPHGPCTQVAAVGDRIAIFASGNLPFVVRQVDADVEGEANILIGSCSIDGKLRIARE
jgi:hypothetical protein